jgi:hypothetical protein
MKDNSHFFELLLNKQNLNYDAIARVLTAFCVQIGWLHVSTADKLE